MTETTNTIVFHVVDDCPEVRAVLAMFIKHAGYESMLFDSAESYLAYLHSSSFTLPVAMIVDHYMGELTGIEMIQRVREILPEQQIVISTGDATLSRCLQHAQDDIHYLNKPFRGDELFSLLETLVVNDYKQKSLLESPEKQGKTSTYDTHSIVKDASYENKPC